MQREPDPVKVLVAIVPVPLFPLFRSRKLRTWPCCCSGAAIVLLLHHVWNIWSREQRTLLRITKKQGKYQLKDPSLPGKTAELKEDWSKSTVLRQIRKIVGGIFFPASARVCGERWPDPGPPPVIPPPAPRPRELRELRAITRVSRAPDPASGPADIWTPGDPLNDLLDSFPRWWPQVSPLLRTDLWL